MSMPFGSLRVLALLVLLHAPSVAAQSVAASCDRATTTAFSFGNVGGTLVSTGTEISRTGQVHRSEDDHLGALLGTVPRDSVVALARFAWRNGFAALPPAPTKPTRNPDAARHFIELHSACGMKHVEYGPGDESKLFRQLWARLTRLTADARHRHR